jgi:hypothetical protein
LTTRPHIPWAIAAVLAVAALALPATSAAGEPKNSVPFEAAKSTASLSGEPKSVAPLVSATSSVTHQTAAERAAIARHRALGRLPVAAVESQRSPVERIIAQERGRRGDPLVFGPPQPEPTAAQIVRETGGFDWADAGIGGAATLALLLLVAGGAALRYGSRRQEAHG